MGTQLQTAEWIKMPLGTEVGLGPDDIVLDGDPVRPLFPCQKGTVRQFSAHVYWGQTLYTSGYHMVRRYASA